MTPPPPLKASIGRNHDSPIITSDFFNSIDLKLTSLGRQVIVEMAEVKTPGQLFREILRIVDMLRAILPAA